MLATLGIVDQCVLLLTLVMAIAVGIYFAGRGNSIESYLLGNRDLPWWAILGSIVATETSTATVLSVPGEGFGATGLRFLQLGLGLILGRVVVAIVLLPMYFRGTKVSAYEVLGVRFGRATQKTASTIFLIARNLGDGLRLYLAALVVEQLVGWSLATSLLLVSIITVVYTFFGGMRSVVWNDCLQMVIYMAGAVASVFAIAAMTPGGWEACWDFALQQDKLRIIDLDVSQNYNLLSGLLGGAVLSIGTHGTDQMMVQRYLSCRSERDAMKAILGSGLIVFFQFALFLWIGIQLATFYSLTQETVPAKADQVYAHFIIYEFPRNTGLVGLMLAAIFAAAMSTLSSSLNSSAAVIVHDFLRAEKSHEGTSLEHQRWLRRTRWMTVVFGMLQVGIGFLAADWKDSVISNALRISGISFGLILGIFVLGMLVDRADQWSAIAGCFGGCVIVGSTFFLSIRSGWTFSPPTMALIAASSTLVCGWAASKVGLRTGSARLD